MRSALAYAGKRGKRVVAAFIATAFAQDTPTAVREQWRRVADQLRPTAPKLAALMDAAEEDVLAYMAFPSARGTKLHSTNPIERLNHELKRRTEVVGTFPNEAAIRRLVGAVLLEQTDEWAVHRARYMPHDTLSDVLDQLTTELSVMANRLPLPSGTRPLLGTGSYTTGPDTIP